MSDWYRKPTELTFSQSWLVTSGATDVLVRANRPGVDALLRHVLATHAVVTPSAAGPASAGTWTIFALSSGDYETQLAELRAGLKDRDGTESLADYWRGDYVARHIGGAAAISAIHHAEPFEGVTVFDAAARVVTYVYPAATEMFLPHLEHLVTHILRVEGWGRGFVDVHGAFVRFRGKGVALIGPRKAGKTSLAMHLLSRGGALLGSDMAQIRPDAQGDIEAASIPHLCRITRETIWDNGLLAVAIGNTGDQNDDYLGGVLFSHGKYELYDPSLDQVFRRPVGISTMKLNAILFPHFAVDTSRHEAAAINGDTGKRRLINSIVTDRPLADWLPFDLADRARGEEALGRCLNSGDGAIPAYDFRFGRESSLDWGEINALFDGF